MRDFYNGGGGGLIFEDFQINTNSVKLYTENHNLDVKVETNLKAENFELN